ncbi:MAG: hypothetical protein AMQ22_00213 [Candidatus Methanofastidiosum methylothiophilum]|uniref:Uncharacterized protein n=1 Tax=Candidatus Methanofastidiosum methylothiophilum TaxID=1705564 RepID=A0A150IT57_9EURY|nr:MAG: hypothetical protein APG11_00829 [Candidatus Methanofastidiosum methylthiophilus]KYC53542.1 MAG: hypothetical protein AMQ22_00213 [Candidatus Methanofastidiosum methylthiophilus]
MSENVLNSAQETTITTQKGRKKRQTTYDWDALRVEYIKGAYKNRYEFAKAKGIPQKTLYRNTKDWDKERKRLAERELEKIADEVGKEIKKGIIHYKDKLEAIIDRVTTHINENVLEFNTTGEAIRSLSVALEKLLEIEKLLNNRKDEDGLIVEIETVGVEDDNLETDSFVNEKDRDGLLDENETN